MAMYKDQEVACDWCGWTGDGEETNPLGKLTEEDGLAEMMRECPECGEPTPTPV